MNKENFKTTLDYVRMHPEDWDQDRYGLRCGSEHCLIGWAAALSGTWDEFHDRYTPWTAAMRWLEITEREEQWLCQPYRTLSDFEEFLEAGTIPTDTYEAGMAARGFGTSLNP